MNVAGLNLDRITLGSLIIALGLLVDDAIIAVEMMVVKMEQGWSRLRAAAYAWDSTAFPMLTGTLVTAVGFLPVGIARSTAGEYAGNIFWIVGLALVVSWIVAVFFTPYIGVKLLPDFTKHGSAHGAHDLYDTRLYRALRRAVGWAVRFRWVVIALTLGAFGAAIAAFTQVQQQFFPTRRGPSSSSRSACRKGRPSASPRLRRKRRKRSSRATPISSTTRPMSAKARRAFPGAQSGAAERELRAHRHDDQGAEARERLKARLEGLLPRMSSPRRACASTG